MQTSNPEGGGGTTTSENNGGGCSGCKHQQSSTMSPPPPEDDGQWGSIKAWALRWRGSKRLVLVIVAIALLLDNMLLTVVGKSQFFSKSDTSR